MKGEYIEVYSPIPSDAFQRYKDLSDSLESISSHLNGLTDVVKSGLTEQGALNVAPKAWDPKRLLWCICQAVLQETAGNCKVSVTDISTIFGLPITAKDGTPEFHTAAGKAVRLLTPVFKDFPLKRAKAICIDDQSGKTRLYNAIVDDWLTIQRSWEAIDSLLANRIIYDNTLVESTPMSGDSQSLTEEVSVPPSAQLGLGECLKADDWVFLRGGGDSTDYESETSANGKAP